MVCGTVDVELSVFLHIHSNNGALLYLKILNTMHVAALNKSVPPGKQDSMMKCFLAQSIKCLNDRCDASTIFVDLSTLSSYQTITSCKT